MEDNRREVLDSLRQILEKWSGDRDHQGHYREYSRDVSEQHERKSFLHWVLIDTFRFLLVSLTMDAILRETTAYHRRQRLGAGGEELYLKDMYGTTLERIRGQGGGARLGAAL